MYTHKDFVHVPATFSFEFLLLSTIKPQAEEGAHVVVGLHLTSGLLISQQYPPLLLFTLVFVEFDLQAFTVDTTLLLQQLQLAPQPLPDRIESQQAPFLFPFLMKMDEEKEANNAAAASLSSKNFLISGSS